MSKSYILIDDDKIINFIHSKVIKTINSENTIHEFQSSVVALNFIKSLIANKSQLPDYIFIDINMPEISGLMLVDELSMLGTDSFSTTKIFVLSSTLDFRDKDKVLSYPFITAFVGKPLTIQLLQSLHEQYK